VLLGIPHPPSLSKGAPSRQAMIALAGDLHWSGLLKADWDPDEHPRWPAGNADGILEGTKLELPDGGHFFAILFSVDLEGWRKQIEFGAKALGRATAKVLGGDVIISDGRSYPLSNCKIEFQ
jgi:hypothetical protein